MPRRAPRPLVSACGAVVLGSAWGALGLRPLALLGVLAAVALVARRISVRRGPGPGPPARLPAVWLWIAAAGAAWSAGGQPAPQPLRGTVRGFEGRPLAEGRLALDGSEGRAALAPVREALRIAPGTVADDEWVGILSAHARVRAALGPASVGGRAHAVVVSEIAPDELVRLAPASLGSAGRRALAYVRGAALARTEDLRDPLARGLSRALLLGERDQLDPQVVDVFTRTGTRHLLALSGLHVGLAAWLVAGPLATLVARALRGRGGPHLAPVRAEGWRALAILLAIPMGGSGAPVTRAALALALASLAPRLPLRGASRGAAGPGRRADALSLWAAALVLECAFDPHAPARVDVQLSYSAVLGLLLATAGLRARLLPVLSEVDALGRRRSPYWLAPVRRAVSLAADALAASVAATLATLPVAWARFGEASPFGIVATAAALPPLGALLVAGWAGILAPPLLPLVGPPAHALVGLLRAIDALPATPVPLPPRPLVLVALASAAGLLALSRAVRPTARTRAARVACLAFGGLLLPWAPAPRGLEVVALDVGHGTAVVARAPGDPCRIFDAGSRARVGVATRAVAPLLRAWEVDRIDVVLSHADRDHASALPWLVERWPVRTWAGAPPRAALGRDLDGVPVLDLERGRLALPVRRGTWLDASLLRGADVPGNEGSRSLCLEVPGARLLLCGDAEGAGLDALLRSGALDRPCALLLVPHHGSDSPYAGRLLAATRPAEAWVSGEGRPAIAVELERRGLRWRDTAEAGWLALRVEP